MNKEINCTGGKDTQSEQPHTHGESLKDVRMKCEKSYPHECPELGEYVGEKTTFADDRGWADAYDKKVPQRTLNEDNPQYVLGWNMARALSKEFIESEIAALEAHKIVRAIPAQDWADVEKRFDEKFCYESKPNVLAVFEDGGVLCATDIKSFFRQELSNARKAEREKIKNWIENPKNHRVGIAEDWVPHKIVIDKEAMLDLLATLTEE